MTKINSINYLSSKDLIKFFEQQEKNKKKEIDSAEKADKITGIPEFDDIAEAGAATEAETTIESATIKEYENDEFVSAEKEKKENTEKMDADSKINEIDDETVKLLEQYKKLFETGNGQKSQEEISLKDSLKFFEAAVKDAKYNQQDTAEKIADAAIFNNIKEDNSKKLDEAKKQKEINNKKENEKSIAENKYKDPKIDPFSEYKDNPFVDIEEDKEEAVA